MAQAFRYNVKPHTGKPLPVKTKHLLQCGLVAGPLFMITLLVEGILKPGYDPIRHPGSSLALGPYGWIQSLNFLVSGLLALAFAMGVRQVLKQGDGFKRSWLFIAYWAIGLIGAGIFTTDPVNGYPLGTPNQILNPTIHGSLHDLFSVPAFIAMAVAFLFVFSRWFNKQGRRGWAQYTVLGGVVLTVSFGAAAAAFAQVSALMPYGGLLQRIAALTLWGWLTMLAAYLLRKPQH
jgi:hypothetical membrane protein